MGLIETGNPAWDYIETVPDDDLLGTPGRRSPASFSWGKLRSGIADGEFVGYRDQVTTRWTWAIPAPQSLDFIVEVLDGRPVVEIGAGVGYWAWQLAQRGVDVNAYDAHPLGTEHSWFSEEHLIQRRASINPPLRNFHPIIQGTAEAVELPENHDRVLFLCWPTMDTWAYDAARHFLGDTIIFIGEGPGGCTADSNFFSFVGEGCGCWTDEDCHHDKDDAAFERWDAGPLIQWSGLHDHLTVYKRKDIQ